MPALSSATRRARWAAAARSSRMVFVFAAAAWRLGAVHAWTPFMTNGVRLCRITVSTAARLRHALTALPSSVATLVLAPGHAHANGWYTWGRGRDAPRALVAETIADVLTRTLVTRLHFHACRLGVTLHSAVEDAVCRAGLVRRRLVVTAFLRDIRAATHTRQVAEGYFTRGFSSRRTYGRSPGVVRVTVEADGRVTARRLSRVPV